MEVGEGLSPSLMWAITYLLMLLFPNLQWFCIMAVTSERMCFQKSRTILNLPQWQPCRPERNLPSRNQLTKCLTKLWQQDRSPRAYVLFSRGKYMLQLSFCAFVVVFPYCCFVCIFNKGLPTTKPMLIVKVVEEAGQEQRLPNFLSLANRGWSDFCF